MQNIDTEKYKGVLLGLKSSLMEDLKKAGIHDDFSDEFDEDAEENEAESISNKTGEEQAIRDRLAEIDAALERIGSGRYAVCTQCGEGISERLLEVVPESSLCEQCKRQSSTRQSS